MMAAGAVGGRCGGLDPVRGRNGGGGCLGYEGGLVGGL